MARRDTAQATQFARYFSPEFLSARRDISTAMLAAAEGKIEVVRKCLKEDESQLNRVNKDGNTLLLLAAANQHSNLTQKLLDLKADAHHRNAMGMDVIDYAMMEGSVWSPMVKAVISAYDFLVPEALEGPYKEKANACIAKMKENGILVARSSILGRIPDFSDVLARDTEYRHEWITSLRHVVDCVKKGLLLLDSDVGYLERDAVLTGSLEVPAQRRFVYCPEDQALVKFSTALQTFYKETIHQHVLEACSAGNATAVQGLLKAQAQPNADDVLGQTALMRAAHIGDPIVLKCLIKARASINAQNKDGYSAIFLAAVHGHEPAVRVLLRAKADLNQRSYQANSALDFAKHLGHKNITKLINEERERMRTVARASRRY